MSNEVTDKEVEGLQPDPRAPSAEQRRVECEDAVNAALSKYNCALVPKPITEPMGRMGESLAVRVQINVVPMEPKA